MNICILDLKMSVPNQNIGLQNQNAGQPQQLTGAPLVKAKTIEYLVI